MQKFFQAFDKTRRGFHEMVLFTHSGGGSFRFLGVFWGLGPGKRVTCRTAFKVSLKRPCPHINRQLQVGFWYSITFCPLDYQRMNVRAMLQLWIHHQILRLLWVFARLASLEPAPVYAVRQAPRHVSQRKSMLPGSGTWWGTINQPHLNLGKRKFWHDDDKMIT